MRTWKRTPIEQLCGRCGAYVPVGEPILEIAIAGVAAKMYRCVKCEGPAPADLPARTEPVAREPVRLSNLLPLDWRQTAAALRAREPGDDDQ